MRLLKILMSCILFLNLSTAKAADDKLIAACCITSGLILTGASIGGFIASASDNQVMDYCTGDISVCCKRNLTQTNIELTACAPQTTNKPVCESNFFPYCPTTTGFDAPKQEMKTGAVIIGAVSIVGLVGGIMSFGAGIMRLVI